MATLLQLILFAMPLICWLINVWGFGRRIHWLPLLALSSFASFLLILVLLPIIDMELADDLARYDTNGDGKILGSERTPEARYAERAITADTGRALASVIGLPIHILWTALFFSLIALVEWVYRMDGRTLLSRPIEGEEDRFAELVVSKPVERNPDDGNPYQSPGDPGGKGSV